MAIKSPKNSKMTPINYRDKKQRIEGGVRVHSFTIFEVTVVLAILSVLITIVSVSINRFNEQMKITSTIQEELNTFYAFRSNLWHEFYRADSIQLNENEVHIYSKNHLICYKKQADFLVRKTRVY